MNKNNTHHQPGVPRPLIADTREKAFQRAICNGTNSFLDDCEIVWIDFELPVRDSGRSRDKCIDLLGVDSTGQYVICEAKFAANGNGNGSPLDAGAQVCKYDEMIDEYGELFRLHRKNPKADKFDLKKFLKGPRRKIVVGNRHYFDVWAGKIDSRSAEGVEYYAVDVAPDCFDKQKKNSKTYSPNMPRGCKVWVKQHL